MAGQTGYRTTLSQPLGTSDTSMVVNTAPTPTSGRLRIKQGSTEEWVSYTGVSGTTLTGLTRGLSQTADPSTAGTGQSFIAGAEVKMVLMHDQLIDKQVSTQILQEGKTYATTTARDTALGGDGVCTVAYTDIYCTDTGLFYNYNLSTNQWESIETGTTTPNASTTVAGKIEVATSAESIAGTDTGGTGATLSVKPSDIAKNIQSNTFLYGHSTDVSDTYTVSLTPALTAYTTGQQFTIKFDTANTGACTLNINGLGAKNIKNINSNDLFNGVIEAGKTYTLIYDGTNFILQKDNLSIYFGDGSDGNVTISTNTTLTRDMYYNNLTINNGYTLYPAGYKIFVKGTLTNNGTISRNGNNGTNGGNGSNVAGGTAGTGATALTANNLGTCYGGGIGGVGGFNGSGSVGTAGSNSNPSYSNQNGVAGGTGNSGVAGGSGGTTTRGPYYNTYLNLQKILSLLAFPSSSFDVVKTYNSIAGAGGGGGGDSSDSSGGGGGGGGGGCAGGIIFISANIFDNTSGTIIATGGTGGNGGNGYSSGGGTYRGGGGGGGGGGGIVFLVYQTLTALGTVTLTGGTGGTKGLGYNGGVLYPSGDGANGTNGNTGVTIQVAIA